MEKGSRKEDMKEARHGERAERREKRREKNEKRRQGFGKDDKSMDLWQYGNLCEPALRLH
jgi:hypothetical protein